MPNALIDRSKVSFQPANLISDSSTGDAHTPVLDEDEDKMLTFIVTYGSPIHPDMGGHRIGYESAFTRMKQAHEVFETVGLDQTILDAMIRQGTSVGKITRAYRGKEPCQGNINR